MPPEQQVQMQDQTAVAAAQQSQAPQIGYAGFWVRAVAYILDTFIVSVVVLLPINLLTGYFGGVSSGGGNTNIVIGLVQMVLAYSYFIYFTNKDQATIGKKLLGLRVVSEDGSRLSLGRIAFRETIGRIISSVILFIGYLMIAFTAKKQGLHDLMVKSIVLSNKAERKTWALVLGSLILIAVPIAMVVGIFILFSLFGAAFMR